MLLLQAASGIFGKKQKSDAERAMEAQVTHPGYRAATACGMRYRGLVADAGDGDENDGRRHGPDA